MSVMEKKEKVRRLRPQSGKRLRELRELHQLRQMDFAEQVNEHMRVKLPMFRSSEALTQSMVSDLELGNADLSILHLFAISSFFGVAPLDLLGDGLQAVGKSEIKLCGVAELRNCGAVAEYAHTSLCQSLDTGHFFVCAAFPSGFFASDTCFECCSQLALPDAEHIEFYPLEVLISFLFAPTGKDSKQAKIRILERMRDYFSSSIYRRLYFIPSHLSSRLSDPCMNINADSGVVTLLFPDNAQHFTHVEVNNREFAETLYKHYYQGVPLVHDALSLLDIAHQTLTTEHAAAEPWAALQFFYQQCVLRTRYADWVRECFNPDVQALLHPKIYSDQA